MVIDKISNNYYGNYYKCNNPACSDGNLHFSGYGIEFIESQDFGFFYDAQKGFGSGVSCGRGNVCEWGNGFFSRDEDGYEDGNGKGVYFGGGDFDNNGYGYT